MRHATLAFLIVFAVVASLGAQDIPRMTVFPQIAVGSDFSSDFYITNQGYTTVQGIELSLFKDSGVDMVVNTSEGAKSFFQFSLQPGETKVIRATAGAIPDPQGFAELFAPHGSSLRATMIVRWSPQGQTETQLGVPEQYPFSLFSVAAEVNDAGNTALAIAIPTFGYTDVRNQNVLVSLADTTGAIIATRSIPLNAGQHKAFFLRDTGVFADLNLTNWRGRVLISGSDWLSVAALRLEGSSLGTVAVDDGTSLAPYFLNQTPTNEVEPNDSSATAQALTLPVVVSGTISSDTDKDIFSFTGTAGQIISAMVDTQSGATTSDLDSQIVLQNAAGDEIAWNDQNGTQGRFENDSLIRIQLPATGTYRLVVTDYWGDGGPTFTYKLHVKKEN